MRITINGTETDVDDGCTVAALVTRMGIQGPVAVERNREVVPRAEHGATTLAEGDVVEIVHFVGGG